MFKVLYFTLLAFNILLGQSYLGFTSKNVKLKELLTVESAIVSTLHGGTVLFVISAHDIDGFFNVIAIESNQEGFVHKSYLNLKNELSPNTENIFYPVGKGPDNESELNIFNRTNKKLTLKLNQITYYFEPKENRRIKLKSGKYDYRASALGVVPDYGSEYIENI